MRRSRQQAVKLRGWLIPFAYTVAAVAAGLLLPRFEHHYLPKLVSTISPDSAISICAAIASGMITLNGVVFSLAFVMIQFSATAYSPRLVLWVARDPVISHALGIFSSTFFYSLFLLAWIDRGQTGRVPLLSSWLVLALLVASTGMFIALIDRIGRLQVNRMLIFTGDKGRQAIEDLYPSTPPVPAGRVVHEGWPVTQTLSHRGRPEVIQFVHIDRLVGMAKASGAFIEVAATAGDTVLEPSPLLRVFGGQALLPEAALRSAIETGEERTFDQDPKYALRILVDIAIKALSPAINDPTTAVQALDHIEDLLIQLGQRCLEVGEHADEAGVVRLRVPVPTWDDFLLLGLDEIRSCGANSVQVMRRMNALIKNLRELLPASRQEALRHWEERLSGTVERSFQDAEEKQDASVADRQGLGVGEEKPEGTA